MGLLKPVEVDPFTDAEHRAVAEAIAARDADAAERTMRAHLASVHRLVLRRLAPGVDVP